MGSLPGIEDFAILQDRVRDALATPGEITWKNGYPVYPAAVTELMNYITSSAWCERHYKPSQTREILDRLERVELPEICCLLTAVARSERFCNGAWESILAGNTLPAVVRRAGELLRA